MHRAGNIFHLDNRGTTSVALLEEGMVLMFVQTSVQITLDHHLDILRIWLSQSKGHQVPGTQDKAAINLVDVNTRLRHCSEQDNVCSHERDWQWLEEDWDARVKEYNKEGKMDCSLFYDFSW